MLLGQSYLSINGHLFWDRLVEEIEEVIAPVNHIEWSLKLLRMDYELQRSSM